MRSSIILAITMAVPSMLLACSPKKSTSTAESTMSISNSAAGIECKSALYKSGTLEEKQGLALTSDGQNTKSMNENNPDTYTMTVSEFRSACAGFNLYP